VHAAASWHLPAAAVITRLTSPPRMSLPRICQARRSRAGSARPGGHLAASAAVRVAAVRMNRPPPNASWSPGQRRSVGRAAGYEASGSVLAACRRSPAGAVLGIVPRAVRGRRRARGSRCGAGSPRLARYSAARPARVGLADDAHTPPMRAQSSARVAAWKTLTPSRSSGRRDLPVRGEARVLAGVGDDHPGQVAGGAPARRAVFADRREVLQELGAEAGLDGGPSTPAGQVGDLDVAENRLAAGTARSPGPCRSRG
jgi:hypothetical protein